MESVEWDLLSGICQVEEGGSKVDDGQGTERSALAPFAVVPAQAA